MQHTTLVPAPPLSMDELGNELVELLPQRETLWAVNVVNVIGINISLALNAASINATAASMAAQQLSAQALPALVR